MPASDDPEEPVLPSLTQDEARERAALLSVERYDLAVDLRGLLTGDAFAATSTITFTCREPGASTFLDCAAEVLEVVLNGRPVEGATGPRIALEGLAADNVVVVRSVQRETDRRAGVHRSVDASDGAVYVWTSFEPDEARRAWACFDQPDLKAVFGLTVDAPPSWTVTSSGGQAQVTEVEGGRRWAFPDTPPLSTYVPALNAGPFHEVRRTTADHDLGLYCRRSLAACLDRDAEELLDLTEAGLAFFAERFAMPFPQRRYDQVFVPEMGGAMENWGCVTWSDAFVHRDPPSDSDRQRTALVLLHEMAHMWFGDLVTMRWWDDLWLNEAFAEWACHWAAVSATPHTDAWASFLGGWELGGYASDRAPTSHPVRQAARDVAAAAASFDNITYAKGAASLKQLAAWVGEEAFVAALREHFAAHAYGNATLDDLIGALGRTSGKDTAGWAKGWLETAGTDVLRLDGGVLRAEGPFGGPARPHRLDVGVYAREGDGLVRRESVPLLTSGAELALPDLPEAELLLLNDDDLTFAVVQPDGPGVEALLAHAADLPTATSRTLALTTAWQLVALGELDVASYVACACAVLPRESATAVVEPLLQLTARVADVWSPARLREELMAAVADTCLALVEAPATRLPAVRSLARTATTEAQLARLAELADAPDLRWARLQRLAALGRLDEAEVAQLVAADPDPDVEVKALVARAALPDAAAKDEGWQAVVGARLPLGSTKALHDALWQRGQEELLAPYAERFRAVLPDLGGRGMIPAMAGTAALFPVVGADGPVLERLLEAARSPEVHPVVARTVVERADEVRRMLVARG